MVNDRAVRRYSAHHALSAIGEAGQNRISSARVLLVGLGGLGCPVAQYLAGSGVGELAICDFDTVSESNLARQLLYTQQDVGRLKTEVAAERLAENNSRVRIQPHQQRADRPFLERVLPATDLVIDASDNYGTRLAVNKACLQAGLAWVMGSCIRMEGQLMLFDPADKQGACYRCVYGQAPESLEDCPGAGIFAPVAGMVGTAMAQLALGSLAGLERPHGLFLLDAERMNWQHLDTNRDPRCPDCAA
jgi:adenylyltransferase/sulfurtransferase